MYAHSGGCYRRVAMSTGLRRFVLAEPTRRQSCGLATLVSCNAPRSRSPPLLECQRLNYSMCVDPRLGVGRVSSVRCMSATSSEQQGSGSEPGARTSAREDREAQRPKPQADGNATQQDERGPKPHWLPHGLWNSRHVDEITITHEPPQTLGDRAAYWAMQTVRTAFDTVTGYGKNMTEEKYLNRMLFLETVAGIPPMVGGMTRHLHSLRGMRRDYGWIHTLLEEAENERMHLMTFLELKKPTWLQRLFVVLAQGVMFNAYFVAYLVVPKYCHRWVGYLEEEAVKTYTRCLEDLEAGRLPAWTNQDAPLIAKKYWQLPDDAKMLELIKAVRADEAHHRDVNHGLSATPPDKENPFHEVK